MTVRDKLREIGVRLVELATYLNISRPTIYKYLELYEAQEFGKIDKVTYDLFTYVDTTNDLSKPGLMNYLINNILPSSQVIEDNYVSRIADAIRRLRESPNLEDQQKLKRIEELLFVQNTDKLE
jgi:hypothetical protein